VKTIGRYKILDQIGQGALAVAYRARDRQLDRQVALKELKPSLLDDPTALIQIQQEARTIARLEHPHIVAIHDVYEAGDRLFIVMQLVDGSSLDRLLTGQGRLAWPGRKQWRWSPLLPGTRTTPTARASCTGI